MELIIDLPVFGFAITHMTHLLYKVPPNTLKVEPLTRKVDYRCLIPMEENLKSSEFCVFMFRRLPEICLNAPRKSVVLCAQLSVLLAYFMLTPSTIRFFL